MQNSNNLKFDTPSFTKRIKSMLSVDFYRLFHTPLFYIFLAIAAIIPAMVIGTTGMEGSQTGALFTNVWQGIAVETPLYVVENIGQYANMNMVFIFGGIMVSIFIGHDYKSGYVKQLFTTHALKQDYMISKSLVCAFAMVCMCASYFIGGTVAGLLVRYDTAVNAGSLILAILGKMVLSLGWASLYTFLNVIFRRYFGLSIASSFFFGTGILIIGVAAIVEGLSLPTWFLNAFLYGSSVNACLASNIGTFIGALLTSVIWAVVYNIAGTYVLNNSDVY